MQLRARSIEAAQTPTSVTDSQGEAASAAKEQSEVADSFTPVQAEPTTCLPPQPPYIPAEKGKVEKAIAGLAFMLSFVNADLATNVQNGLKKLFRIA